MKIYLSFLLFLTIINVNTYGMRLFKCSNAKKKKTMVKELTKYFKRRWDAGWKQCFSVDNLTAIDNAKKDLDSRLQFLSDLSFKTIKKLCKHKDKIDDDTINGVIIGLYKQSSIYFGLEGK